MPALIPDAHNPIDSDTTAGVQFKMESASGFVGKQDAISVFVGLSATR